MDESCTDCHQPTGHRALDEHGSRPLCGMCLLVLVGDLTRAGVAVTLVVPTAVAASDNRGWTR